MSLFDETLTFLNWTLSASFQLSEYPIKYEAKQTTGNLR